MKKVVFFLFLLIAQLNPLFAQMDLNQVTSVEWGNNSLIINTTSKITYAESHLKDPDRVVIDILNCSFQNKPFQKNFKSELDESISISEPTNGQIRIVFVGSASINRKAYITNNERTLIVRIARINPETEDSKISESSEQTLLEKHAPGKLKDIFIEEKSKNQTRIIISATKSMKYNTYLLKNPDRFAIDLLNILLSEEPLPKYKATSLVSGLRIGSAASGIEATRIVIDLAKQNLDVGVNSNLLGNKIEIKFEVNKEKEEIARKSGIKVVIDPGHGGYDTGASYGGFEEKDINLIISGKLKKYLEDSGITVFLTREDDSFLSLAERVEIGKSIKPNVFISVHNNALYTSRGIRGIETYYWSSQSQKLAYYLHKSILSHVNIPDHYLRRARFYVIRYAPAAAVLVELGFLSNHDDRQLLTNASVQDKYAKALSEAILKFLDVEPKKENRNGETAKRRDGEKTEKKQ